MSRNVALDPAIGDCCTFAGLRWEVVDVLHGPGVVKVWQVHHVTGQPLDYEVQTWLMEDWANSTDFSAGVQ